MWWDIKKGLLVIGYWSSERGLFQSNICHEKHKLKQQVWPGYAMEQPPKLRFGVPVIKGFTEFVKVEKVSPSNPTEFSGFVVDVFLEVLKALPFPVSYEFVAVENYEVLGQSGVDPYSPRVRQRMVVGTMVMAAV
ncbi:hypothetical protein VNO78_06431 [Psophocarpus tetragonolobus]|uniref:Uncharacterized protein n=1 Tax=Psophocarpus tetragonolobus TaxID=3891 RepID=A0AAN9XR53_PSOTE